MELTAAGEAQPDLDAAAAASALVSRAGFSRRYLRGLACAVYVGVANGSFLVRSGLLKFTSNSGRGHNLDCRGLESSMVYPGLVCPDHCPYAGQLQLGEGVSHTSFVGRPDGAWASCMMSDPNPGLPPPTGASEVRQPRHRRQLHRVFRHRLGCRHGGRARRGQPRSPAATEVRCQMLR